VHDAKVMLERGLGDQEIRDRDAVSHSVVMSEVALEPQPALEEVRRCGNGL
jgi:hypothetical protein